MTVDRDGINRALPNYEVGDEIGRGAFGVVLRAEHRQLGRPVAVKELAEGLAADPDVRRRFASEARLLATLDHPHIVPIYDYVEREGLCLLVMELLSGGTVLDRFTNDGLSADAACSIVLATCSALQHAHGKGILHRDIKPGNLLFTGAGTLKVADFGIAKVVGGAESMGTRTGQVLGTPAYMAPEQALGRQLTPATDVYAVGTMLYQLLSGRLPFTDEGIAIALLYQHAHEDPVPLTEVTSDVPASVAEVIMRSLAREPGARYATAEDFGVALADSATAAWGQGWVRAGGVNVVATGPIGERIAASGPSAGTGPATTAPVHATPVIRASDTPAGTANRADADTGAPVVASPDELVPLKEVVAAQPSAPPAPPSVPTPPAPHAPPAPPTVARRREPRPPEPAEPEPGPPKARRRGRSALVAVAVLALVGIVAALVFTLGGGSSGSPKVTATIPVGPGADHVAAGNGGIWVTTGPSHTISRIDPGTNQAAPIALLAPPGPHSIAVVSDGLWVNLGGALASVQPGSDPSKTRTTNVPVGVPLSEIAVGEGSVWATASQDGMLVRVDPKTQQVVARIGVGPFPDSVAVGEGGVWVANRLPNGPGTVTRVDPSGNQNQVVATIPVGVTPDEVAVGEGAVWVANSGDGTVSRIDPATNKVSATIRGLANPQWVVVGEGAVWVTNTGANTVSRIDPAKNEITATVGVGRGAESSTVGEGSVWVVNKGDGTVSRISPG